MRNMQMIVRSDVRTSPTGAGVVGRVGVVYQVLETGELLVWSPETRTMRSLMSLHSEAPGWDDLRFPAQGINPAGAAAAPSVSTTLADYPGTLSFSGSQDNIICGVAQMPHAWERATSIVPHIHWAKASASANTVDWRLYIRKIGNTGDAPGAWSSALTPAGTVGTQANANEQLLTYWAAIDMTGMKESAMICWRLDRLGSTDSYSGVARLYELDFHYKVDKAGTLTEIPE